MRFAKITAEQPVDGHTVMTRIADSHGTRNEQVLTRRNRLWFLAIGEYIYYEPTHWRPLTDKENCQLLERQLDGLALAYAGHLKSGSPSQATTEKMQGDMKRLGDRIFALRDKA